MHGTALPPTTLPLGQAATLLGVHPETLREWAARGRLRSMPGDSPSDRLFRLDDLASFLASGITNGAHARHVGPAAVDTETTLDLRATLDAVAPVSELEAQIDSIAKLGTRLNRLASVADIGSAICLELRQLIDYHNVRVYRIEGEDVLPVAWRGEVGVYVGEDGSQLRLRVGQGITGWVALNGQPQYLPDAARDPRAETIPGTEDMLDESMILAPMRYDDRTIGVIVLSKLGLDQFGPRDLRYLGIYASIAGQAMVNAAISERLLAQEEALRRQAESQRELLRVTESILSNLDPGAVMEEIATSIGDIVGVDDLAIYVHEPSLGMLRPIIARGPGAERLLSRPLPDSEGEAAVVLASGVTSATGSAPGDAASRIVVPLRGKDRALGVLLLERTGADARFEPREVDLVRLFAAHVSIALTNALTHRAVELRAQTDALTGLKNHGTFGEDLSAAIERRETFAVLMIDLDDFKAFNDRRGHEAGNERLKRIAEALRAACRERDEVYRYGGDEFALLLPWTSAHGAMGVAQRIRLSVAQATRGEGDPATGTRCSIGVACYPDDGADRTSLLQAADRALYSAKRDGGDRIRIAS
jgi:diguanylate cyclase (GGDEF)-like protein